MFLWICSKLVKGIGVRTCYIYIIYVYKHNGDLLTSEASEEAWVPWMLGEAEFVTAKGAHKEFVPVTTALTKTIEALPESPY